MENAGVLNIGVRSNITNFRAAVPSVAVLGTVRRLNDAKSASGEWALSTERDAQLCDKWRNATSADKSPHTECRESFKVLRGELNTTALAKPDFLIIHGIR